MIISKETRREIVQHAIRWASNILAEVLSNHAREVDAVGAACLREAVTLLAEADRQFRGIK